jgi:uncharacterized protein
VETLVLGPKAVQTAESYVLGLFHLYPNVYLHKKTRGAEMVFHALMRRQVKRHGSGSSDATGLPAKHPLVRFLDDPASLERAVALDDAVFWGALPMLIEAEDQEVGRLAIAFRERRLPHCINIRSCVEAELPQKAGEPSAQRSARIKMACDAIVGALRDQEAERPRGPSSMKLKFASTSGANLATKWSFTRCDSFAGSRPTDRRTTSTHSLRENAFLASP